MDKDIFSPATLLRDARILRGLTLKDVASKNDMSVSYLSEIESGLASPKLDTFLELCTTANVSPADIMTCYVAGKDKPAKERIHLSHYLSEPSLSETIENNVSDVFSPGALLKRARTYKKLKLKEVAAKTGISQSYISEIENSHKTPNMDNFIAICDGINISPLTVLTCYVTEKNRESHKRKPLEYYIKEFPYHDVMDQFQDTKNEIYEKTLPSSKRRKKFSLGAVVRKTREHHGLTLANVSQSSDISMSYLSDLENDRGRLGIEDFLNICNVINESPINVLACYLDGKDKAVKDRKPVTDYLPHVGHELLDMFEAAKNELNGTANNPEPAQPTPAP